MRGGRPSAPRRTPLGGRGPRASGPAHADSHGRSRGAPRHRLATARRSRAGAPREGRRARGRAPATGAVPPRRCSQADLARLPPRTAATPDSPPNRQPSATTRSTGPRPRARSGRHGRRCARPRRCPGWRKRRRRAGGHGILDEMAADSGRCGPAVHRSRATAGRAPSPTNGWWRASDGSPPPTMRRPTSRWPSMPPGAATWRHPPAIDRLPERLAAARAATSPPSRGRPAGLRGTLLFPTTSPFTTLAGCRRPGGVAGAPTLRAPRDAGPAGRGADAGAEPPGRARGGHRDVRRGRARARGVRARRLRIRTGGRRQRRGPSGRTELPEARRRRDCLSARHVPRRAHDRGGAPPSPRARTGGTELAPLVGEVALPPTCELFLSPGEARVARVPARAGCSGCTRRPGRPGAVSPPRSATKGAPCSTPGGRGARGPPRRARARCRLCAQRCTSPISARTLPCAMVRSQSPGGLTPPPAGRR